MPKMFTAEDLDTMQLVRCAFDPASLCNPGKIFPTPRLCGEVPGSAVVPTRPRPPGGGNFLMIIPNGPGRLPSAPGPAALSLADAMTADRAADATADRG